MSVKNKYFDHLIKKIDNQFDWVINTAGQFFFTDNSVKDKLIGAKFYDLSYAQVGSTFFLENIQVFMPSWQADGLGMLVEQAAESFTVWHQRKPEINNLLNSMREI